MKKVITTALLTLATGFGFAQDAIPEMTLNLTKLETTPLLPSLKEKISFQRSFGYLKMGVSDSNLQTLNIEMLPGFGIGYRLISGASAFDLSASFNRRETITDDTRERVFLYTLPKANYLYYVTNSLYAGGGVAWGGVKTEITNFVGLVPNASVGYELQTGKIRSFFQLDVSQPAIPAIKEGALPKAFAELSVGAGF